MKQLWVILCIIGVFMLISPYVLAGQRLSALSLAAASGHPADVQAAVDQVIAAGGGTVNIPAGDWQFDEVMGPPIIGPGTTRGGSVTINLGLLPSGAWLNIIGAAYNTTTTTNTGQTITCPATILRSSVGNPLSGSSCAFHIRGSDWAIDNQNYLNSANRHIRISYLTILGKVTDDLGNNNNGIIVTDVDGYLIDHCTIDSHVGCDIGLTGSKGVVSHCQILQTYHLALGGVWGYGIIVSGNSGYQTPQWVTNLNTVIGKYDWQNILLTYSNPQSIFLSWNYHQGTADYNNYTTSSIYYTAGPDYIEDNYFSYVRHGIASNGYGFYVARYNVFNYSLTGMPLPFLDIHGIGSPSGRGYEAYGNTFINNPIYGVDMMGGGGVIFNNNFVGPTTGVDIGCYWYNASVWDPQEPLDIWIWHNTFNGVTNKVLAWTAQGVTAASFYSDVQAIDYATMQPLPGTPTAIQPPRPNYVPYQYPHPLAVSGGLTTATTEQTTTLTTTQRQTTQTSTVTTHTTQSTSTNTVSTQTTVTQTTSYQTTVTQVIIPTGFSAWYAVQGIGAVFLVAGAYSGYVERKGKTKRETKL